MKRTTNKVKLKNKKLSSGTLDEVFGLWKGKNISLDKIREEQWERKH